MFGVGLNSVRLACVRHAASVRPEPGSNSLKYGIKSASCRSNLFQSFCSAHQNSDTLYASFRFFFPSSRQTRFRKYSFLRMIFSKFYGSFFSLRCLIFKVLALCRFTGKRIANILSCSFEFVKPFPFVFDRGSVIFTESASENSFGFIQPIKFSHPLF